MQSDSGADSTGEAAVEFASQGGYAALTEVQHVLTGAGLPQELWGHTVASLSVGERLWLRVAEALIADADLLILDEPTSHLDIQKRAQLAAMLQELDQPYVVVSHDRHFLDLVCTQVLELTRGHARLYAGGYTEYVAAIRAQEEHDRDIYAVQTRKVKQLKKSIGGIKEQAGGIEALAYKSRSGFFSHKAAKMEKRAKAMRTQLERSLAEAQAAKPFIEKKRTYVLEGSTRGGILVSLVRVTASFGEHVAVPRPVADRPRWRALVPAGAKRGGQVHTAPDHRRECGSRMPVTVTLSPSIKVGFVPQQIVLDHGDELPIDLVRAGERHRPVRTHACCSGRWASKTTRSSSRSALLSAGQQKRVFIARLVAGAARPARHRRAGGEPCHRRRDSAGTGAVAVHRRAGDGHTRRGTCPCCRSSNSSRWTGPADGHRRTVSTMRSPDFVRRQTGPVLSRSMKC